METQQIGPGFIQQFQRECPKCGGRLVLRMKKNSEEVLTKLEALKVFILKVSKDFANFLVFYQPEEDVHFRKIIQQKMNNIINVIWYQNPDLIDHEYRSACLTNAVFKQLVLY